jgi:alpha-galactosidase
MRHRYLPLSLLCLLFPLLSRAQAPIVIETAHTALVLREGKDHRLYQQYLGARLAGRDAYASLPRTGRQAYVSAGMNDLFTPAIRMVHSDGNPSLELH